MYHISYGGPEPLLGAMTSPFFWSVGVLDCPVRPCLDSQFDWSHHQPPVHHRP